ncbi:zinc finger FYVE domain-containing protein 1-like isoform X1 [Euwallacea similis]|uniref:zinc finger FYVE domain-containing protein 1-like isoform X1 n=1 Tax=Euwallacea similis TaxID=1736056 RepID=UPI00344FC118
MFAPRNLLTVVFFLGKRISSNMDNSLPQESMKKHSSGSPILNSIDPIINNTSSITERKTSIVYPDITKDLYSLNLEADELESNGKQKGILLIDEREQLKIESENVFLKALHLKPGKKVKVVSIFGNTGEGKSYTLNKVFFNGVEVFKTSPSQVSCTLGIWAKYDPNLNVICLDTEGFLGISKLGSQRERLLLKVLAVSDIIIYKTRAERLPSDLYTYLGTASDVYNRHFSGILKKALAADSCVSTGVGPGVIIFHQTLNTNTLHDLDEKPNITAEDILRDNFSELGASHDAFSFLKYVGVKTSLNGDTSFELLKSEIQQRLESSDLRSPRDPKYIYLILKSLNDTFHSPLSATNHQQYLMQFFTCPDKCQSCMNGCTLSMNHGEDGESHKCDKPCKFQHQYQNYVFLCKKCIKNGKKTIVKSSYQTSKDNSWTSYFTYVWSGYVIECPVCGEIYRSRQHWYGNKSPEESAVQLEVVHIWPGDKLYFQEHTLFGNYNSAQKVVDSVSVLTDAVTSVGSPPARMITDWVNGKIAPSYWRPNAEIKACAQCNVSFVPSGQNKITPAKHHCRSCGEGFCESCSSKKCAVPHKGWTTSVRVCDSCYQDLEGRGQSLLAGIYREDQLTEVRARYLSETVVSSITAVKSVLDMSKDFIKDKARPSYWTPDNECTECALCTKPFGTLLPLHHCRDCGRGVCDSCSNSKKIVPLRGWHSPVRVCNSCR